MNSGPGRNSTFIGIIVASASLVVSLLAWLSPFSPIGPSPLGREQQSGTLSEPPPSLAARDSSDGSVEGIHPTSSYAQSDPRGGEPTAAPTQRAALPDPQNLYNSAYNDYLRGKYDLALRGFEEYLKNFPETELADNAAYWIGECHYRQGYYRQAVDQLEVVLSRYPRSDKAASVLLRKGYALIDLGDSSQGVMQLRQVVLQYPTSDEANLARKRLRELGADGG
jgi:tol-pal system protein YbgF